MHKIHVWVESLGLADDEGLWATSRAIWGSLQAPALAGQGSAGWGQLLH